MFQGLARGLPGILQPEVASQPGPQLLLGGSGCQRGDVDGQDGGQDDGQGDGQDEEDIFGNYFDNPGKGGGKCERGTARHCSFQGFNDEDGDDDDDDDDEEDDDYGRQKSLLAGTTHTPMLCVEDSPQLWGGRKNQKQYCIHMYGTANLQSI